MPLQLLIPAETEVLTQCLTPPRFISFDAETVFTEEDEEVCEEVLLEAGLDELLADLGDLANAKELPVIAMAIARDTGSKRFMGMMGRNKGNVREKAEVFYTKRAKGRSSAPIFS